MYSFPTDTIVKWKQELPTSLGQHVKKGRIISDAPAVRALVHMCTTFKLHYHKEKKQSQAREY